MNNILLPIYIEYLSLEDSNALISNGSPLASGGYPLTSGGGSNLYVYTDPVLVVTVDELKKHLRITGSSEDDLLESYLLAAQETLEAYLGMNFIQYTYRSYFDYCDCVCGYEIRKRPFQNVLKVLGWNGTEYSEIDSSNYVVKKRNFETFVYWKNNDFTIDREVDYPIIIDFNSGFGTSPDDVPESIKTAIKMMASKVYESRGDCGPDCPDGLCVAKAFVRKYKPLRIGTSRRSSCGCMC